MSDVVPDHRVKKAGRPKKARREEVPGEGVLRAMRFVFRNEEGFDRTGEERVMRAWLKKDPKGFFADLEARERADRGEEEGGADHVDELIDRLLAEGLGHG